MRVAVLRAALAVSAILCAACASSTGVVPKGDGVFYIAKQAGTGFPGLGNLKGEVLQEAGAYCSQAGKTLSVTHEEHTQPPYVLGNYPRVELEFVCK